MSDRVSIRLFCVNFEEQSCGSVRQITISRKAQTSRRVRNRFRFCFTSDLRQKGAFAHNSKSKPLLLPVSGGQFEVWLTYETHRLPGGSYASLEGGTARLWLICPECRRPAAKLFFYRVGPYPSALSRLLCRGCHNLTYRSVNCGKNAWYKQFAKPLKKLSRRRSHVERWRETPRKRRFSDHY